MKLFKQIRITMLKKGNIKRYFFYAIGEILLVMIGISLAFQLNNWNDNRIKQNTEVAYYKNIKEQIEDDKNLIVEQLDYNNHYMRKDLIINIIIPK